MGLSRKARQARSGHRGHVSAAAHSLEAGCSFIARKKVRQARSGHRGHVSAAAHSLEVGCSFIARKKMSRRVTLADSFFLLYKTSSILQKIFRRVGSICKIAYNMRRKGRRDAFCFWDWRGNCRCVKHLRAGFVFLCDEAARCCG
ncbi:MAG: hypothetical protein FWF77_07290 [Defluviitaleaceae bacterium]|nr:hypothetical protein [Defluviitaleaceae bacterium]